MSEKKTLLIIPAYNEEMNIGGVLDTLKDAGVMERMEVLVVDDGSLDATAKTAAAHGAKVLSQCFNMGYGAALQTGYKYAVAHDYEYLLQMDADGQHDVSNLERILDALTQEDASGRKPDIVIGSRFLEGSESFRISGLKRFAIGIFRRVIRTLTGYHLTDLTSGLQGLDRAAFSYYAGYTQFDIKYPDLNMIVQMLLLGFHIVEIPAVMHARMAGTSMHDGIFRAGKYMILMTLGTYNAVTRFKKGKQ